MTERLNLLEITDSVLRNMLNDHRIIECLPCLASAKAGFISSTPGSVDCPRCESKRKAKRAAAVRSALQCIQSARGSKLATLKHLLNAKQLRLTIGHGKGKVMKITM